jgi:tetratricopeptide (TPR) repeat protein
MKRAAIVVLVLACSSLVRADLIHLKDGKSIEGTVKKVPDGWQVTEPDGKVTKVPTDAVRAISSTGGARAGREDTQSGPDDKLASLRRSVEYVGNARDVVDRYKRFIQQNSGTTAADEAKKDLAIWQDRADRNMVKVGSDWVTHEQHVALQVRAIAAADDVRKLMAGGRLNEANAILGRSLEADPSSPTLLFLKGVIQYKQEQVPQARRTFEAVKEQLPNHAAALNNLAVIAARQNQWPAALSLYEQAMVASPQNRQVLDNVAEALNSLPENQRNLPILQKVAKRFGDQDLALAAKLQQQGLYRWGATWVDNKQLEELKKAEQDMRTKLDALSAEFDTIKTRINNIDREIGDNERAMRDITASRYYGRYYERTVLPSRYYDLEAENQKLHKDRDEQSAKLEDLRNQARTIQKSYPIAKYSGTQKLIEAEGAPVSLPTAPTSQPAPTQPADPARRAKWKV